MDYVVPELRLVERPEKLATRRFAAKRVELEALLAERCLFVIAEPGFGKTRLLKELAHRAADAGQQAIVVDLKAIRDPGRIAEFLHAPDTPFDDLGAPGSMFESSRHLRTSTFALPAAPPVARPAAELEGSSDPPAPLVCLDALDEVVRGRMVEAIEAIKRLGAQHPQLRIVVSCRTHHIERYSTALPSGFRFVEVIGLDEPRMVALLRQVVPNPVPLLQSCSPETQRILQVPRYMGMFADLARAKQDVQRLSRNDLFEHFIYGKLRHERTVRSDQPAEDHVVQAVARTLEALALVMRIRQTNVISGDELVTFFDDVRSNLANFVWGEVPPAELIHCSLLKSQPASEGHGETVEFEVSEFQEYLAAKELNRLAVGRRSPQLVYDLMVASETDDLLPAWYNTLHFVVDREPSLLPVLMRFGFAGRRASQPEAYHRLLTTVTPGRLEAAQRRDVFDALFGYYDETATWFPWGLTWSLARYVDESGLPKLEASGRSGRGEARLVRRGNVAGLIERMVEERRIGQASAARWRERIVGYLRDGSDRDQVVFATMQRQCVSALAAFRDLSLLESVEKDLVLDDSLLLRTLVGVASEIDPNARFVLDLAARAFKSSDGTVEAFSAILRITSREGLTHLIARFHSDPALLDLVMQAESVFDDAVTPWIVKMAGLMDEPLQQVWAALIRARLVDDVRSDQPATSSVLNGISRVLARDCPAFLEKLATDVMGVKAEDTHGLEAFIASTLAPEHVRRFVSVLGRAEDGMAVAVRSLLRSRHARRPDAEAVFAAGRPLFRNEYRGQERAIQNLDEQKRARESADRRKALRGLAERLEVGKEGRLDAFHLFLQHQGTLKTSMTHAQRVRLIELLHRFFEHYDPRASIASLVIVSREGNLSFRRDGFVDVCEDAIRTARALGVSLDPWRQKLVRFLPLDYANSAETVLDLVEPLQDGDVDEVAAAFAGKKELRELMSSQLLRLARTTRSRRFDGSLRQLVGGEGRDLRERAEALEVLASNGNEDPETRVHLTYFFNTFLHPAWAALRERANEMLIRLYADEAAVAWRIGQLEQRAFACDRKRARRGRVLREVAVDEEELDHFRFAGPIMQLESPRFLDQVLKLVRASFIVQARGNAFERYAEYLRSVVVGYVDGLKRFGQYEPINRLEAFVNAHASNDQLRWFRHRLAGLRDSYLAAISRPQSIRECVAIYNSLKGRSYLDVAYESDLFRVVCAAIEQDVRTWIESEGAYSFLNTKRVVKGKKQAYEDLIQRTVIGQLRAALLRRGLRDGNIIIREPQLLDRKRLDFVIWHGFIGPVIVELKLTHNPEVATRNEVERYRSKVVTSYMQGTGARYAVFVLLHVSDEVPFASVTRRVKAAYRADADHIAVIPLDCTQGAHHDSVTPP